jgi:diguanylate cyclase (GGDEF)-like protein
MQSHRPAAHAGRTNGPLPDPRRLLIGSIIAMVVLACSVVAAAFYAVQTLDRLTVEEDVRRATAAIAAVAGAPDAETRLREDFLLEGARFTAPGQLKAGETMVAVPGRTEVLAWTPSRLGSDMFYHLAPLRVAASGAFLIGVYIVLRKLYGLARELDRRRREMAELATRDALTGLGNRLAFQQWLVEVGAAPAGLLYLDLDGFKQVNDRMGHGAGDELLQVVARRIASLAGPDDLVARIGGDEFAFVRKGPIERQALAELAADIGAILSEPVRLGASDVATGASVGIAIGLANDPALVAAADAALYRAKALPGHTYVFSEAA